MGEWGDLKAEVEGGGSSYQPSTSVTDINKFGAEVRKAISKAGKGATDSIAKLTDGFMSTASKLTPAKDPYSDSVFGALSKDVQTLQKDIQKGFSQTTATVNNIASGQKNMAHGSTDILAQLAINLTAHEKQPQTPPPSILAQSAISSQQVTLDGNGGIVHGAVHGLGGPIVNPFSVSSFGSGASAPVGAVGAQASSAIAPGAH